VEGFVEDESLGMTLIIYEKIKIKIFVINNSTIIELIIHFTNIIQRILKVRVVFKKYTVLIRYFSIIKEKVAEIR
jgi:hypothetical protein